jgi:hypothetical protein
MKRTVPRVTIEPQALAAEVRLCCGAQRACRIEERTPRLQGVIAPKSAGAGIMYAIGSGDSGVFTLLRGPRVRIRMRKSPREDCYGR